MTSIAFFLILLSVSMHAGWNFLFKFHKATPIFTLVVNICTLLLLLPFVFLARPDLSHLGCRFWLLVSASALANTLYFVSLTYAYKLGDISVAYPLARSIPVLLTALVTIVFHLGTPPGKLSCVGFVILFLGCVILPQQSFKSLHWRNFATIAMLPILLAAIGTTTYTTCDSEAGRALVTAMSSTNKKLVLGLYFFVEQVVLCLFLAVYTIFTSGKGRAREFASNFRDPYAYLAGFFNIAGYYLVLLAMTYVTNVSYVQAFRQMSLPIGVFMGVVFLHEKVNTMKLLGLALIVAGLILTTLS